MMAVSERRERAAEILADGLVRLLKQTASKPGDQADDSGEHVRDCEAPCLKLVHSRDSEAP